jgi:hypothetical protein
MRVAAAGIMRLNGMKDVPHINGTAKRQTGQTAFVANRYRSGIKET